MIAMGIRRRSLLAGIVATGATCAGGGPRLAMAASGVPGNFRDGASLLVAGPDGGRLDVLSRVIVPPLARALPPGTPITRTLSGGTDGVTAANQFSARTEPDGLTLLMVPGTAALAWLAGDPRAQFDAGSWVPVMAATTPSLVVARLPGARVARGTRLRVAASTPAGPEMPALLALDLSGVLSVPVFGLADAVSARQALVAGSVDAIFVRGPDALEQVAMLDALGARPLFGFGDVSELGGMIRDPLLPAVPDLAEFAIGVRGAPPRGALFTAWQGAAAASRLEYALVLPQLTPAAMVALWRRAGSQTAGSPEVTAASHALRVVAAPAANAPISAIAENASSLLELRRWLAIRFNWRP